MPVDLHGQTTTIKARGPTGNIFPTNTISGAGTDLNFPDGLDVDAGGVLYVANEFGAGRYSAQLRAVLGTAPLHWRLVGGHLPRGLRLSRAGRIAGTARRLGSARFTVRVTDSTHRRMTDTRKLSIDVRRPPSISAIVPAHGRRRGGTAITITGSGFATRRGATFFSFGRVVALDLRCRSRRRCTARVPPHALGTVKVSVTVQDLASKRDAAGRFRYTR